MRTTKTDAHAGSKTINYHAEGRFTLLVPPIIEEFFDDGIRYYRCEGKRTFVSDIYDRMLIAPKLKIIPVRKAGQNKSKHNFK